MPRDLRSFQKHSGLFQLFQELRSAVSAGWSMPCYGWRMHAAALLVTLALSGRALAGSPLSDAPVVGGATDVALVVSVEDYAVLPDVPGADQVGGAWHRWLADERGLGPDRARWLRGAEASPHAALEAIRALAPQVGAEGTFWFVFVGHGGVLTALDATWVSTTAGPALLVSPDVVPGEPAWGSDALSLHALVRELGAAPGRQVVVLDAGFTRQDRAGLHLDRRAAIVPAEAPKVPPTMVLLQAASQREVAGALPGSAPELPAFASLALGALWGRGDADGDHVVTAEEVVRYARGALAATLRGRTQTPSLGGKSVPLTRVGRAEPPPDLGRIALSVMSPPPDVDGDGIADGRDACPTEAEDPNTCRDFDGCPERALICHEGQQVRLLEPVQFRYDQGELDLAKSRAVLDELATLVNAHPEWRVIEIRAHRASDPDESRMGRSLTQRRAEAVTAYLIEVGRVARERLRARGFGETAPLVSNVTPLGRFTNRRVEVHVVDPAPAARGDQPPSR